jgi:hypothetical protein
MTAGIGAGEWFQDGVDCLKISRTVESLKKAMLKTMTMTLDERIRLKDAAMQSARQNFESEKWMTIIEQLCLDMSKDTPRNVFEYSRQVLSAFLFLGDMWKQSLNTEALPSERVVWINDDSNQSHPNVSTKSRLENFFWEYGMRHAKTIKKIPVISRVAEKYFFKLAEKK